VSVLPLPATLAEMRDISFSEALALLDRLRAFFDLQVVDLGGFSNAEFMAQIVKAADTVVLVAEQSVGAIVSAAELLQELKKREVERDDLHLLVSRFDAELGWMRNRSPSGSAWPRWARCPTGAPRCCRPPIVARAG
jgi:pilus assembly protein CpaE